MGGITVVHLRVCNNPPPPWTQLSLVCSFDGACVHLVCNSHAGSRYLSLRVCTGEHVCLSPVDHARRPSLLLYTHVPADVLRHRRPIRLGLGPSFCGPGGRSWVWSLAYYSFTLSSAAPGDRRRWCPRWSASRSVLIQMSHERNRRRTALRQEMTLSGGILSAWPVVYSRTARWP